MTPPLGPAAGRCWKSQVPILLTFPKHPSLAWRGLKWLATVRIRLPGEPPSLCYLLRQPQRTNTATLTLSQLHWLLRGSTDVEASACLRTFALAVLSAWNAQPPDSSQFTCFRSPQRPPSLTSLMKTGSPHLS